MDNYSLKKFLQSPFPVKVLPYLLLLFALLGFLDMSYLTIDHYRHFLPPCTIHGCDLVLTSGYATIVSIPLALLGALYFLAFIVLAGVILSNSNSVIASEARYQMAPGEAKQSYIDNEIAASQAPRNDKKSGSRIPITGLRSPNGRKSGMTGMIILVTFIASIPSLLVSVVLVGLQAFVLHAFCQYCLFGELMFFLIFDTSWWIYSAGEK